ncbi:MAG: hypothetical protein ACRC0V_04610 [Fusobacteriaceae bacterium]
MKKIGIVILIFIALSIGLYGVYTATGGNEPFEKVQKEVKIVKGYENISITGISQDIEVHVIESAVKPTNIIFSGNTPKSTANKINELGDISEGINLDFRGNFGVAIAKNIGNKEQLKIVVEIEDVDMLKKLVVLTTRGNIEVYVPQKITAKYTNKSSGGAISSPKSDENGTTIIECHTGNGDIKIEKQ